MGQSSSKKQKKNKKDLKEPLRIDFSERPWPHERVVISVVGETIHWKLNRVPELPHEVAFSDLSSDPYYYYRIVAHEPPKDDNDMDNDDFDFTCTKNDLILETGEILGSDLIKNHAFLIPPESVDRIVTFEVFRDVALDTEDGKSISKTRLHSLPIFARLVPFPAPEWKSLPSSEMDGKKTEKEINNNGISILSWNVLAQSLTNPTKYPWFVETDRNGTKWVSEGWRLHALITQIEMFDADIVCLQEIDTILYGSFWKPRMRALGYDGKNCNTPHPQYGQCIFWKNTKFTCSHATIVGYDKLIFDIEDDTIQETAADDAKGEPEKLFPLRRGLIVCLEAYLDCSEECSKEPCEHVIRKFTISTTHLWTSLNRNSPLLRVLQARKLLTRLKDFEDNELIIMCGDFNDHDTSALYKFVTQGAVDENEIKKEDWECYPESVRKYCVQDGVISHPLKPLYSAYHAVLGCEPKCKRKPEDTEPQSVIEYIMATKQPRAIRPLIPELCEQPLPIPRCAADHVPIFAVYDI